MVSFMLREFERYHYHFGREVIVCSHIDTPQQPINLYGDKSNLIWPAALLLINVRTELTGWELSPITKKMAPERKISGSMSITIQLSRTGLGPAKESGRK